MTGQFSNWQRYSYAINTQEETTATKVLRLVGHNKQVLELGCATGSMTQALKEQNGCSVVAIEIDPVMAERARPFCDRLLIADLETLDVENAFGDERFGVIVAADVLEHLRDPWTCLETVRGLLKPEGYLVISVPNVAHNALIAQLLAGRFPYQEKGLLDRTHLRFFTRHDLEDMLLATGYLPAVWERNRVSEEQTEFARLWLSLPQALRDSLKDSAEGQAYQFIVKAFPSSETGWVAKARTEKEQTELTHSQLQEAHGGLQEDYRQLQEDYGRLQEEFSQTLNSFAEYRKAFAEAKQTLEEHQSSLAEHQKAFQEARDIIDRLQTENKELSSRLWDAQRTLTARLVNRVRRWLP